MYAAPGGFAEKWAQARRFYESDLASGFVRVQAELWAASLSNAELREKFLPRLLAWKQLVLGGGARGPRDPRGQRRASCRAPSRAEVIACWISRVLARHGVRRPARREGGARPAPRRARRHAVAARGARCARPAASRAQRAGRTRSAHGRAANDLPARQLRARSSARCPSPAPCPTRRPYPFETVQPVREGFVERDGVKIWYAVWGDSGPWLAFAPLFQIAHSRRCSRRRCPTCRSTFRVITMDGRGNGRSDRPRGQDAYSFDHFYADFVAVLDAAGVDRVGGGRHLRRGDDGAAPGGRAARARDARRHRRRLRRVAVIERPEDRQAHARRERAACAATGRATSTASCRPSSPSRIRPSRTRTACATAGPPSGEVVDWARNGWIGNDVRELARRVTARRW